MANGFNTEVLRRSIGRDPRTLLEFANLPQVQSGPSSEAMIADIAGQTIKGIGQQILQAKKLDLDAQRTAAQIGIAQDTHALNIRKQEYAESSSSDNQLIEAIQKADYISVPDIINQFSDSPQGNKLKEIYGLSHSDLMSAYQEKEAFESYAAGRNIGEIISEEGGKRRLDNYMALNLDDARFNIKRDARIIGVVDEYNKNRGYYDLVSDKEQFKENFGLKDVDYALFEGLNPKQGQELLIVKLQQKNPAIDPKQFERNFTVIQAFNREIQTNEQSIRNFQDRIKIPATSPERVVNLEKRIENLTNVNAEKRRQINILTKPYQPSKKQKILDIVVSTKQETVDGKIFNVDFNKDGQEIQRTLSKEPVDPFEVKKAEKRISAEAAEKIPKDAFTKEDILSFFTDPEDRKLLNAKYLEMKNKSPDRSVNMNSPDFRNFLDGMGFFQKLRLRELGSRIDTLSVIR
jgi:hypothetical protein